MQSPSYMDLPSKPKQEWKMVNRGDATFVSTPLEAFEPLPLSGATMKASYHDANVFAQIYSSDPSKENVIDTSNHFSALVDDDGNLCGEDDSPTTASPDHFLWLTKIKNIDGVPIIGLSSPSKTSSEKKKKKRLSKAAKKGMESSSQAKHGGTPWIVVGDFNVSRRVQESVGGSSKISVAIEEFDNCLQSAELDDLRFSGFFHTWCNKRSNGCISKKLDRVLVNKEWMAKFEHSEAFFLPPSISDHNPSLVNFHGNMQFQLCSKLQNLKNALKSINKNTMGDVTVKSIEAKAALVECQRNLDLQPFDASLRIQEKELMSSYTLALQTEEDFLRQKSRV
ncbi:hypothetical protein Ddye_023747 [Dipteronia dyeriana]|uniref:Uncharacterized protein n=1 Tax=Dipteronia dyeriana TaxID=168575 RepID=A0AAD9WSC9_9ROSI|nr:hypothetical protein Ddye_023747 [Dipteronia dyeriana]